MGHAAQDLDHFAAFAQGIGIVAQGVVGRFEVVVRLDLVGQGRSSSSAMAL
jgi:hypothetical protein